MVARPDARAIARRMKAVQDSVDQIEPFTTDLPDFDLQTTYEAAHLIHRARLAEGAKSVGRKIGFTNPDMWAKFGVLESFTLTLSCEGRLIETGKGSNVLGNPLAAVTHLLSVLAKPPGYEPLHAGEIVTTGTITTAQSVRPGETWCSEVHGIDLPGLTVEFSA